ncbi:hypothetical protein AX16_006717 [Volvariella volvacea WC 439]|nr:hypothetical protein AX16_006717 [Volvariella volvacea WC 439]
MYRLAAGQFKAGQAHAELQSLTHGGFCEGRSEGAPPRLNTNLPQVMFDQLALELVRIILQPLDSHDLCNLSTLCHTLHTSSLNELFSRTRAFRPFSLSESHPLSFLKPMVGTSIELIRQSQGLSLMLNSAENLHVLRGLRLALPHLFHGRQITVIFCLFGGSASNIYTEIHSLIRFLTLGSVGSTVGTVIADFRHLSRSKATPQDRQVMIVDFLQLFHHGTDEKAVLPQCVSLSIMDVNVPGKRNVYNPPPIINPTNWLTRVSAAANAVQKLIKIAPSKFTFSSQSKSITASGLCTLNLHSNLFFDPCSISSTINLLTQHSRSLRSLSFNLRGLSHETWSSVIPQVCLPNLEELYFSHSNVPLNVLSKFLIRHQSIKVLDVGDEPHREIGIWQGKRPSKFLQNLVKIKGTRLALDWFLCGGGPPIARTTLQFATVIFPTDDLYWFSVLSWVGELSSLRPNLAFTLRIRMIKGWVEWLKTTLRAGNGNNTEEPLDRASLHAIRSIEVCVLHTSELLAEENVRLNLVSLLEGFPGLSSVEILGSNQVKVARRRELCELVKARVPKIESFCINGIRLF